MNFLRITPPVADPTNRWGRKSVKDAGRISGYSKIREWKTAGRRNKRRRRELGWKQQIE